MSFDCSRFSFRPWNDFLGVVMQQGRVQLDADWNEWVAELARRLQAGSLDTFGPAVVPRETPNGFRIVVQEQGLAIGPGRIYVDGLLAENHGTGQIEWDRRLAEEAGTGFTLFFEQPYLPFNDEDLPPQDVGSVFNRPSLDGGPHLVYVDVWQREVTYLQSRELVEKAVGVDTTGRLQTVWQVKLLENIEDATCASPDDEVPGWDAIVRPSAARLTTSTGELPDAPNPCLPPPSAGYKGLENQLYRVEIHRGGAQSDTHHRVAQGDKATFKWSRDNATVASRVSAIPTPTTIVVESVGRDGYLRFSNGDWIEILDDWHELHGLPGVLRRIRADGGVDDATRTITLEAALPTGLFPVDAQGVPVDARNTRVRRWDQAGKVLQADGSVFHDLDASGESNGIPIPPAGTSLFLEHGIQVSFDTEPGGGLFKTGDYWVFAARATDGTIDLLSKALPRGIHHHYARLSVISDLGPAIRAHDATDCRSLWPPEAQGESCDCTICVQAEAHNAGIATIQHAINKLTERGGGTICLDVGTYRLDEPLHIKKASSLRIRGQGWRTVCSRHGALCTIEDSVGVTLERMSFMGSATEGNTAAMITAINTVDLRLQEVAIMGVAERSSVNVALALAGHQIGTVVSDCALVADQGMKGGTHEVERNHLLTAQCRIENSFFLCQRRAVDFEGLAGREQEAMCLHYGELLIADNFVVGCGDAGFQITGATLPGGIVAIRGNVLNVNGTGIRAGTRSLRIDGNEVTGAPDRIRGDGIDLVPGLDPRGIEDLWVTGNALTDLDGHGIAIRTAVGHGMITSNIVRRVAGAALLMEEDGSAEYLAIDSNRFVEIGLNPNPKLEFVGIQLLAVARADVRDNLLTDVARVQESTSPGGVGLLAAAFGELRVAGNRVHGVGPTFCRGTMMAMRFLTPFRHLAVAGNSIARLNDIADQEGFSPFWQALGVGPEAALRPAAKSFAFRLLTARDLLITATRVRAIAREEAPGITISGNQLTSFAAELPAVAIEKVETCLFIDNYCRILGKVNGLIAKLHADHINVSNNRLICAGGGDTLRLHTEHLVAVGNISIGNIKHNGNELGERWKELNLFDS
ncbi:hypothetical protein E0E50_01570 [Azotobacter chroococcum subsp. isscasi]|uniref:DUF6519 domain-containing protein n=1 Tax=Azotobacter chroococcum TaxID=353 RepID=UPI00103E8A39|nr:DUF6519 domain-containing protein [Azotobacter chroococcum]TBW12983.1 hypothetical protein E0E50_01570 [Azotobacter chroococcum subsp. isscasi]